MRVSVSFAGCISLFAADELASCCGFRWCVGRMRFLGYTVLG